MHIQANVGPLGWPKYEHIRLRPSQPLPFPVDHLNLVEYVASIKTEKIYY